MRPAMQGARIPSFTLRVHCVEQIIGMAGASTLCPGIRACLILRCPRYPTDRIPPLNYRCFMRSHFARLLLLACLALLSTSALAADWVRFRGPQGSGTSEEQGLPTTWSATENIAWRSELPGPGTSSPIVVGDRIYLTSYSG